MKKMLLTMVVFAMLLPAFAVTPVDPVAPVALKATAIRIPLGQTGQTATLDELAHMKASEYGRLMGHRMKLFDRISFSIAQRQLRNSINADGTVSKKALEKLAHMGDGEAFFHFGGFALGFFLGAAGVIIAYILDDEKRSSRIRSAWIGWGLWAALVLTVLLVVVH